MKRVRILYRHNACARKHNIITSRVQIGKKIKIFTRSRRRSCNIRVADDYDVTDATCDYFPGRSVGNNNNWKHCRRGARVRDK